MRERRLEIRLAAVDDVEHIHRLVREAYAVYVPRIGSEPVPMRAHYGRLVSAGVVWVAIEDEQIVGVVVLRPRVGSLLLENVAVAPSAQGRGIGRMLIRFAEGRAIELGLPRVELYTNARMTENLVFYPRLGYVEIARRREHGFDRVFYEKAIRPCR